MKRPQLTNTQVHRWAEFQGTAADRDYQDVDGPSGDVLTWLLGCAIAIGVLVWMAGEMFTP